MAYSIGVTLMSGPRDGETLYFDLIDDPEVKLTIGRRDDCDICLSYDSQVSRIHAHLIVALRDAWVDDLDSRNGTFVRGIRIEERTTIHPAELFRVGRTWMRLEAYPSDETQLTTNAEDIPF